MALAKGNKFKIGSHHFLKSATLIRFTKSGERGTFTTREVMVEILGVEKVALGYHGSYQIVLLRKAYKIKVVSANEPVGYVWANDFKGTQVSEW